MADELTLEMYDFLIAPIRAKDMHEGALFAKRLLEGGQEVWSDTQTKISDLKKLWSITDCPDEFLKYLKNIVGWTKELNYITDQLDDDTLRRLISVSAAMWKRRGAEIAIKEVVNVALPSRLRIWNWFDMRWITDETAMDEQRQGRDSWLLPFPGPADNAEYYSIIRVVDPGTTEGRKLLTDMIRLMRPVSERYTIIYLKFLDLFEVGGDLSQWDLLSQTPTVADGHLELAAGSAAVNGAFANIEDSIDWENVIASARLRVMTQTAINQGAGLAFCWDTINSDGFVARIDVQQNRLSLVEYTAGSGIEVAYYDFGSYPLQTEVWYGLRVQATPVFSSLHIHVYLDGEERIVYNGFLPTRLKGTVGILQAGTGTTSECDEIEVLRIPVESELIDINT